MRKDFYAEYFEVEDRHWWFLGRRRILLSLLARHLPETEHERRIVDVGCGTGTMLQQLSRFGRVQGADGDPEAIRFCRERGLPDIELIRLPVLPFDDAAFDLLTLLDVLEHVDEDFETLQSIHRVLKPGGTLLLAVPAFRFLWGQQDEISLHKRRYVVGEIRELLTRAGFEIVKLSYFNTFLFPFIAGIRVLRPFPPRAGGGKIRLYDQKPALDERRANRDFWCGIFIPPLAGFPVRCVDLRRGPQKTC